MDKHLTPARLAEERDFERRMKDGNSAKKSADNFRKAEAKRFRAARKASSSWSKKKLPGTARFKIARAFKPGWGKLS